MRPGELSQAGRQTETLVERIIRSMQDKQAELAAVIYPLCRLNLESAQWWPSPWQWIKSYIIAGGYFHDHA